MSKYLFSPDGTATAARSSDCARVYLGERVGLLGSFIGAWVRGVHRSKNNSRAALPSKAHHSVGGDAWQLYPRSSLQGLRAAELVRESSFLAVVLLISPGR